jgi:PleD family two-component response regulator
MDIEMPEMDGIKGAKLLKAHKAMRDIPVVMVTTKRGSDALRKAFAAGAVDFINKPVNEVELLARVDSVLRLKRELDLRQARERELSEANLLLKEANERLEKLSRMDGLTGAPNRRYFNDNFHKEWLRCARDKKHLSIIMIDIDFFKKYNDAYGHLQGDECLKQVAGAISSAVRRPGDLFARYGGEEFVVMLPDTNVAGAKEVS